MFATQDMIDIFGMSPDTIYIQEIREPQTSKVEKFATTIFDSAVFSVKAAVVLTAVTALAPVVLTAAAIGAPFVIIGTVIVAALVAKAAATVLSAAVVFGVLAVLTAAKIIKTAAFFVIFVAFTSIILGESRDDRFVPENRRVRYSEPRIETRVIERRAVERASEDSMIKDAATAAAIGTFAGFATILAAAAIQYGSELVSELAVPAVHIALPIL